MPNKNRTLIKLDDKVLEVTKGKKGLQAKELSLDELCEVSLLDEGTEKFIENDINRLTNEAYEELKRDFKNTLKVNTLKIVGFDNRWHDGWEVDHCNGRSSQLTEYMSNKVKGMFTAEFDKILQPEVENMLKVVKTALIKEFKDSFTYEAKRRVRAQAETAAQEFMKDVMNRQVKKFQRAALEKAETAFLGGKVRDADGEDEC